MKESKSCCPLCARQTITSFYSFSSNSLKKCRSCGLVFVYPFPSPDSLRSAYQQEYFLSADPLAWGYENYMAMEDEQRKTALLRLAIIRNYVSAGKIMEVGCATGFFLDEARKNGYAVEGIEISDFAAEWGRQKLSLPIRTGILKECNIPHNEFEAVTMWDVLEHINDPFSELKEVYRITKNDGYLFLTVPNVGSFLAKAMGKHWFGFSKVREHLFYFNESSITLALRQAGFGVVCIRPSSFHVNVSFLARKVGRYSSILAMSLERLLSWLRLSGKHVNFKYIDMCVVAKKLT